MQPSVSLGGFLRDRRTRLDPLALGLPSKRRRTPGLRREEVAQRAHVSVTWYTWLEQGRGGAPSPDVLDRISRALMLTDVEREHLFWLGLGRPPELEYRPPEGVTPQLQRVLDALVTSPALVRTPIWDVIAWNRAAAAVLTDYSALPPKMRNVLRLLFLDSSVRAALLDWEEVSRFIVGIFRRDTARAGASAEAQSLVDELSRASPEFARMWADRDVRGDGEGVKRMHHPRLGFIALEYAAFAVHGRPELTMLVHNPVTTNDAERIRGLVAEIGSDGPVRDEQIILEQARSR